MNLSSAIMLSFRPKGEISPEKHPVFWGFLSRSSFEMTKRYLCPQLIRICNPNVKRTGILNPNGTGRSGLQIPTSRGFDRTIRI